MILVACNQSTNTLYAQDQQPDWTMMFYMDSDKDLEDVQMEIH